MSFESHLQPSHLKTSDVTQVLGSLKKAFTNLGHTGKTGDIKVS